MDEIVGCGVVVDLDVGKCESMGLIKIPKYRVQKRHNL